MKRISDKIPSLKELDLLTERLTAGGVNDPQQIDFCWLIRLACRRPQNFVGKQSFELLATFLSGYDSALDHRQARSRSCQKDVLKVFDVGDRIAFDCDEISFEIAHGLE